jgi:hypothetical protein
MCETFNELAEVLRAAGCDWTRTTAPAPQLADECPECGHPNGHGTERDGGRCLFCAAGFSSESSRERTGRERRSERAHGKAKRAAHKRDRAEAKRDLARMTGEP